MTPLLESLSRRSRAYNAMYALGEATPETVETISDAIADRYIQAAIETMHGSTATELHRKMQGVDPHMIQYIATGRIA